MSRHRALEPVRPAPTDRSTCSPRHLLRRAQVAEAVRGRRLTTGAMMLPASVGGNRVPVIRASLRKLVTHLREVHGRMKRWTVERTYGWLMLHRRLARDYETHPQRSEAMIHLAMIDLMARGLTGEATLKCRET